MIPDQTRRPTSGVDVPRCTLSALDWDARHASEWRARWPNAIAALLMPLAVLLLGPAVHAAEPPITSTAQIEKMRIGVLQGSAYDVYAQENYKEAKLSQFNSQADLATALKANKVDAGMSDAASLRALIEEQPEFARFGESLFDSPSGAGFRKESSELRQKFDAFLAGIQADGTLEDIHKRWRDEGDTRMPDITFTGEEPVLKVGNAILGLPNVTYVDNKLVGSEVELATRFAKAIGHRPEFVTVDWGALIPSLVSGKIDMVLSDMFITPEREERIAFSKPYRSVGNYFFVLASRLPGAAAVADRSSDGTADGASGTKSTANATGLLEGLKESFYSNVIREDRYKLLFKGLWITLIISIGSCLWGTALGVLICALRMSRQPLLQLPAKIFIDLLRSIPAVVLLMLIFYVLFASVNISPVLVAIFAFGLMFAAYTAEIFRAGLLGIDRGQTEAGISLGFTRFGTFRHIILPQLVQRILPVYKGEFISLVKNTSIVGYVAVQDLTKVGDIIRSRTFDAFFPLIMITLIYLLVIWGLAQALEVMERRTDPERRRRRLAS